MCQEMRQVARWRIVAQYLAQYRRSKKQNLPNFAGMPELGMLFAYLKRRIEQNFTKTDNVRQEQTELMKEAGFMPSCMTDASDSTVELEQHLNQVFFMNPCVDCVCRNAMRHYSAFGKKLT